MIINLLLVVGFIAAYFVLMQWLHKRKRGKINELELIATLPLGTKEKIILVQADNQRFLLGVTQQNVSILASLSNKMSETVESGFSFDDYMDKSNRQAELERIA